MRDVLAIAVADSQNEKIGDCATTYAAQASCPTSCVFFNGGGCYAENGRIYTSSTEPLNKAAASVFATAIDVAKEEADAISHLPVLKCDGRPLRLHTVGDCRTDEAARIVAAAAAEYMRRGGGPVWTYTHAWRTVDRASWGCVSVLASCETPEQVELARARGYATALVVEEFRSRRLHDTREEADGSSADDQAVARGDQRSEALDRQRHRRGRHDDPGARRPANAGDIAAGGREGARGTARSGAAGHADDDHLAVVKIGGGGAVQAHAEASPPSSCRTARLGVSPGIAASHDPGALTGQRPGSASAPVTSARILPCPAQTSDGVTCSSCRLCMDDTRLRAAGYSIGFAIHGTAFTIKQAAKSLRTPSDGDRRLTSRDFIHSFVARTGGWPTSREVMDGAQVTRSSAIEMLERIRGEHHLQRSTQ